LFFLVAKTQFPNFLGKIFFFFWYHSPHKNLKNVFKNIYVYMYTMPIAIMCVYI
jgi:hypothetical protein